MDQLSENSGILRPMEADQTSLEKEKNYFATEFNNEQERIRLRREKEERERTAKVCGRHSLFL